MFRVTVIFFSILISASAHAYDAQIANQLAALYSNMKEPQGDDRTENSSYMVLESLHTAYISYNYERKGIRGLFQFSGKNKILISNKLPQEWVSKSGLHIPLDGLMAEFASVVQVYKNYGVDEKFAQEFAFRIQKEIMEALNQNWDEYEKFLLPYMNIKSKKLLSDKVLLDGLDQVKKIIEVSRNYEIPYLAGYSLNDPKMIYIDSGFNETMTAKNVTYDLADFLYIHEVTEKLLMDEWSFRKNIYVHTHQFAQRLEKEMVEASGLSWDKYQGEIMEKEITRAENPHREFKQTPTDLDLTPYLEYNDSEVIAQLHKYAKEVPRVHTHRFKISSIAPGIWHVYFDSGFEMAKTLLRFQEFYESPEFKGKYFSLEEYKKWYISKKGKFDYYEAWGADGDGGFNIPSPVLEPFYLGKFSPLSTEEQEFLDLFQYRRHANYYIVITASNSGNELQHELAHAMFYLYPKYREEISTVLNHCNVTAVENFLAAKYGDYNKSVLFDEAHAWLMNDSKELKKDGFDIQPYKKAIAKLKTIFQKYKPKNAQ